MTAAIRSLTFDGRFHPGPIGSESRRSVFGRATAIVLLWNARAAQRRHLSELSSRALEDIGISRNAAAAEAAKPFWQA